MTVYRSVGTAIGTREALDLARRLASWHDAMVRHRRQSGGATDSCDSDCPHEQAASLWLEAVDVYGERAAQLTFLFNVGRPAWQQRKAAVKELSF